MNRSVLLLIAAVALPSAAHPEPLSRAEAVARALAVNPEVRRSLEDVAALEGQVDEAKEDALP